jgi:hypothetical protein
VDILLPPGFPGPNNTALEPHITDLFPPDGSVTSRTMPYISWESDRPFFTRLYFRLGPNEPWRAAPDTIPGRVHLPKIRDGATVYYFLAAPWERRFLFSRVRKLICRRGVEFERSVVSLDLRPGFPHSVFLRVRNTSTKTCKLTLSFRGKGSTLPPDFLHAAKEVTALSPGRARGLHLHFTPGTGASGTYEILIRAETQGPPVSLDRAMLYVTMKEPRVDVDVLVHDPANPDGARELVLINKGDGLVDLALVADPPNKVRFEPSVDGIRLAPDQDLRVRVRPLLGLGLHATPVTCRILAAKKSISIPLTFPTGGGREVYFGRLDVVRRKAWAKTISSFRGGEMTFQAPAEGTASRLSPSLPQGFLCRAVRVQGSVHRGKTKPRDVLEEGTVLALGETVITANNGYVLLDFATGGFVTLPPQTTAVLDRAFFDRHAPVLWAPLIARLTAVLARVGARGPLRLWADEKDHLPVPGEEAWLGLTRDSSAYPAVGSADGGVTAAWHSAVGGRSWLYALRVEKGKAPNPIRRLGPGRWPRIWTSKNDALMLYESEKSKRLCLRLSRDGARTWSGEIVLGRARGRRESVTFLADRAVISHQGRDGRPVVAVLSLDSQRVRHRNASTYAACYDVAVVGAGPGRVLIIRLEREGHDTVMKYEFLGGGGRPRVLRLEEGRMQGLHGLADSQGYVHLVWRSLRPGRAATIYTRGAISQDILRLGRIRELPQSRADVAPRLHARAKELRLSFARNTSDGQEVFFQNVSERTFGEIRRLPVFPPCLAGALLTLTVRAGFHPDQKALKGLSLRMNGWIVTEGEYEEGRIILPVDPRWFRFGTDNRISFRPHGARQEYFEISDVTLVCRLKDQEEAVIETTQIRAEAAVRSMLVGNSGSLPDVALFRNRVEFEGGKEEGRSGPYRLSAEIFNLSPVEVHGVKLVVFADVLDGSVLAESQLLGTIGPFASEKVTLALSATETAPRMVLWAGARGPEFDGRNNAVMLYRAQALGGRDTTLIVQGRKDEEFTVFSMDRDREVFPFPHNVPVALRQGMYRVQAQGLKQIVVLRLGRDLRVDLTPRGSIFTQAAGDFSLDVFDFFTGRREGSYSCNSSFEIPVGRYRVEVRPAGGKPFSFPYVRVFPGKETFLTQREFGALLVRAPSAWALRILDAFSGSLVRRYRCNSEIHLRDGVYRVEVSMGKAGLHVMPAVTVPFGRRVEVEIRHVGSLLVRGPQNFSYRILDSNTGEEVTSHWCNSVCPVRAGQYIVAVSIAGAEKELCLGPIAVGGRARTEVRVPGFGFLHVEALESFCGRGGAGPAQARGTRPRDGQGCAGFSFADLPCRREETHALCSLQPSSSAP